MKSFEPLQRLFRVAAVLVTLGLLLAVSADAAEPSNPRLAAMIKKAAQEGEIVYQGPDPATGLSTRDMLRDMSAVTKQYFGVNIKVKVDNALSFPASTAKALTEIKAGAPPTFDLMYQTSVSGSPLYKENATEPVPWLDLFPHIKAMDLEWKGLALINQTLFLLPEYNTHLLKPQDVPRSWEDFLDPKWKGKLGVLIYPDPWKILSQPDAWGEERTLAYLKKLVRLNPKLGRFPEAHQRVVSGETPLAWGGHRERTLFHKEHRGAPIDVAEVEPALLWVNVLFVPKGARHSNAAALMAAAMLTKEGQALQLKYQNATSMFRPNTPAAKFAATHKFIKADVDFQLKKGAELSKKIRAILVKRR
ncbi:MAG: ABC transporter substrate-binding protein [Candidatus Binatia bacterium]